MLCSQKGNYYHLNNCFTQLQEITKFVFGMHFIAAVKCRHSSVSGKLPTGGEKKIYNVCKKNRKRHISE